eukprot:1599405-Amphidinium_carterae.1
MAGAVVARGGIAQELAPEAASRTRLTFGAVALGTPEMKCQSGRESFARGYQKGAPMQDVVLTTLGQ